MASNAYYGGQEPQYAMQPQQPYQQAPSQQGGYTQPPPNYGQQRPDNSNNNNKYGGTFQETFKIDKPKFNDLWAGILLLVVFAGFIVVSGITLNGYDSHFSGGGIYHDVNTFGLNSNTMILFAFVLVVAFVLSWLYITLARLFTKQFIWISGILNIVLAFVTAIYMLSRKYWSGGIVFLLFGIFTIIAFISWIPRIPFSVLMFQTVVDVSKRYGHVYLVSLLGGLIATAFGAWYSVTLVGIYAKYEPGNGASGANPACAAGNGGCGTGKVIGLIVFITFAMFWISEWLKSTVHTVIAGVYASWYFQPNNFPKNATRGAFSRAMTYSFGSISFGSLVVAIINFLRQLCSMAQSQSAQDGNILGCVLFWILGCLIGFLDWAVQFLNRYAFCHIAIYGKAYIPAAKDTWTMIKNRGIDALVNECLVGPVLSLGAVFVAYTTAFMAYLYVVFTEPAYNSNGGFTPVIVAFSFLIGLQIANVFTVPLSSGIDTLFVAMAWDPQLLVQQHPDLWSQMVRVYPQVQQAMTV